MEDELAKAAERADGGGPVSYTTLADGVIRVALNRPDNRNALDDEMVGALHEAFTRVERDPAARCVVLTSTHDSVFSAGGNLKGFAAVETAVTKHFRNASYPALTQAIMTAKVPVLCAMNGHALAGGLGLVLACDLVITKAGARIGTPEINVGVFPFMLSAIMQRNMPRKRLAEMVFMGEQISAEEAMEAGFVNRVVASEQFDSVVHDWSSRLAAKSPLLVKLGKRALYEQQDMPLVQAMGLLAHYLTLAQGTEDVKEGVAAFMEKRPPVWKGA